MVELGRLFQRSHASVVHALQTLSETAASNSRVAQELQLLEEKLAQAKVRSEGGHHPIFTSMLDHPALDDKHDVFRDVGGQVGDAFQIPDYDDEVMQA